MEKSAELMLTDYGTIIEKNEEIKVDTFLDHLKNGKGIFKKPLYKYSFGDFSLNQETNGFHISYYQDDYDYYEYLLISDKQKELLDLGRPSPELLKFMALAEECKYKRKQKEVKDKFFMTGKLPTDPEELVIYTDLLHQELKETNADIIKNSIITSIIPVVFSSSLLFSIACATAAYTDFNDIIVAVVTSTLISTVIPIVGFVMADKWPFQIDIIKKKMEKRDIITERINLLNMSEEKRLALEAERNLTPEGLENQETKNISENSNAFLLELDEVKKKIAMLPEDERKPYIRELIGIVSEYNLKVTAILDRDNNKVVLGDAANLWSLNVSMLPKLLDLGGRIDQRLSTLKEKKKLNDTLEQFKNSVEALDTGKGYTDGWSDDLTSGGVAYATMENGSVTSRRMA